MLLTLFYLNASLCRSIYYPCCAKTLANSCVVSCRRGILASDPGLLSELNPTSGLGSLRRLIVHGFPSSYSTLTVSVRPGEHYTIPT